MSDQVVVVGGGIVGLSCALHARRAGHDVTVVDVGDVRQRASFGNAGVIATCEYLPIATPALLKAIPQMLFASDSPLKLRWSYLPALAPWLIRFLAASAPGKVDRAAEALKSLLSLSVSEHRRLARDADAGNLLRDVGWIKAYESEKAYSDLEAERRYLAERGVAMSALSADELNDLLPGLRNIFRKGTLYSDCIQVTDPGAYVARTQDACANAGVRFVSEKAKGFELTDGKVTGVRTADRHVAGTKFVIAAGAWSKVLAMQLGERVYLDTERGYHAMLKTGNRTLLRAPLLWHEKSVVLSQQLQGLRITSSVEFAGLDAPPRYETLDRTVAAIQQIAPELQGPIESRWLGFRPSTPDSLPVIGRAGKHPNCFMAFGHGHLGLTLGPVTGHLIAQAIAGQPTTVDLQPFSPSRFAHS
ncbi:FAD-binding oxidoreductase [Cupriavidus sp. amp6]|uniref:NAD(P)/FAD-dependent oxidoreductase n=1 Tax=Cupriavidus sp. amp6 TaxID=388051 RepID=UPI00055F31C2|nr:FAD-binding oxidoreductase [Cupriavidus sp. amp6]